MDKQAGACTIRKKYDSTPLVNQVKFMINAYELLNILSSTRNASQLQF